MDTLNLEPFQLTEHPSISFNTGSEPADFPAPVRKTIKLHEFEQALENYTAAMLWSSKSDSQFMLLRRSYWIQLVRVAASSVANPSSWKSEFQNSALSYRYGHSLTSSYVI